MTKVVRLLSVAVLALSLTACGKSKDEKAQDRAKSDIEEQNRLAREIDAAGIPSSYWSDEQLNSLESKLLQLQQVEGRLAAANGKNGVTVWGGNNDRLIAQRRELIASARAEKARAQSAPSVPAIPSTAPTTVSPGESDESKVKSLNQRLKASSEQTQSLNSEFQTCDERVVDASASEIRRCIRVIEGMEKSLKETRDVYSEMRSMNSLPYSLRQDATRGIEATNKLLESLNGQKSLLQILLSTKEQAS